MVLQEIRSLNAVSRAYYFLITFLFAAVLINQFFNNRTFNGSLNCLLTIMDNLHCLRASKQWRTPRLSRGSVTPFRTSLRGWRDRAVVVDDDMAARPPGGEDD